MESLSKISTIGFLGDGQLAKMSAEAALRLGFSTRFLGASPDGPCRGLGEYVVGDISSCSDVAQFAESCDVVTLENEFIPLATLEKCAHKLLPSLNAFAAVENKVVEKRTAESLGLPVGAWREEASLGEINYEKPFMLKLAKGGYDGRGNFLVDSELRLRELEKAIPPQTFILEDIIEFEREVAVAAARSLSGDIALYPVVDTVQKNNVCVRVAAPSSLDSRLTERIKSLAAKFVEGIDFVGVMSLEFFVLKNGEVYFNESAPRPHNSAHYTMDACECSQFENHIRAISNLKLGATSMKFPCAVMLNILGTRNGPANFELEEAFENVFFHLYNKKDSVIGRKMGHANLVGSTRQALLLESDRLERKMKI